MGATKDATPPYKKFFNKMYAAAAAGMVGVTMVMVAAVGSAAADPYNNSWNNNYNNYNNNSYGNNGWLCYGNNYGNSYNGYNNYSYNNNYLSRYSTRRRVYVPYMNCYMMIGYNMYNNRWEFCNTGMPYNWNNSYNNWGYNW